MTPAKSLSGIPGKRAIGEGTVPIILYPTGLRAAEWTRRGIGVRTEEFGLKSSKRTLDHDFVRLGLGDRGVLNETENILGLAAFDLLPGYGKERDKHDVL